jgi:hypothetical protein
MLGTAQAGRAQWAEGAPVRSEEEVGYVLLFIARPA